MGAMVAVDVVSYATNRRSILSTFGFQNTYYKRHWSLYND